tara:strand:+ start:42 stop:716 length:675 start_codon:yes stop_codon:yes gene_type:complete
MLKSFFTHHDETNVFILDNSTNSDTEVLLKRNKVPFLSNAGGLHIKSVDTLLNNVKTQYALLVDTDIIFLKNHRSIFEQFKSLDLALMGEVCGDRGGKKIHNRVHPWHCFIDIDTIKKANIKFYNELKHSQKDGKIYDVGCTFFSDIRENKLKIGNVRLEGEYFKHYEGMSWRTKRYGSSEGDIDLDNKATHNNKNLYEYGIVVEQEYAFEVTAYKEAKIKCKI